ncbi:MarR family winged helix-turn-helix transcriptional regulator [Acetobacterium bakii]|uniref:HTH marR-type domain-containing protein n=1 Tax=Acetobacterium bakii TaxID=52689 RepID=A0A0L6U3F6_9FIRM|nr:MarR family transcriptional regulator [Acetobacterium bakii]KNZ42320.1 hypothetical protein AKG39_07355 [Acetobacterium bakii]
MGDFRQLSSLMERIIHKYNQAENKKRYFGTDLILTRTEIHTVVEVGDKPGLNITALAQKKGITKGAASQMIYKLVDKGLIRKEVSPVSDTEVCLSLTESGKAAYEAHQRYHEETNNLFFKTMRKMPEETMKEMEKILIEFDKILDIQLKQSK